MKHWCIVLLFQTYVKKKSLVAFKWSECNVSFLLSLRPHLLFSVIYLFFPFEALRKMKAGLWDRRWISLLRENKSRAREREGPSDVFVGGRELGSACFSWRNMFEVWSYSIITLPLLISLVLFFFVSPSFSLTKASTVRHMQTHVYTSSH